MRDAKKEKKQLNTLNYHKTVPFYACLWVYKAQHYLDDSLLLDLRGCLWLVQLQIHRVEPRKQEHAVLKDRLARFL